MIGLKRHTVRLVDHQPEWAALCRLEIERLHTALGDLALDIQHVGSTAVPGLPAKPILDVAVAVRSKRDIPAIVACLVSLGYIDRGDSGADGGYLCVTESAPDLRTVYLHVVEQSDSQWHEYLTFRDLLRNDPLLRQQYAAMKTDLAARYPDDRRAYTAGKNDFIRRLLAHHSASGHAP